MPSAVAWTMTLGREVGEGRRKVMFRKVNGNIYTQNGNVAVLRFSGLSTTKAGWGPGGFIQNGGKEHREVQL